MSGNLREDVLEERLREMTARCVQADAEIARLRAALDYILNEASYHEECRMVARTALRGEGEA